MDPHAENLPITVSCENDDCPNPFTRSFIPSDFAEWVQEGEHDCPACSKEMSVEGVRLECHICYEEIEFFNLSQIPLLLDEKCGNCAGRHGVDFWSIRVAGSWWSEYDTYDWSREGKAVDKLERVGRSDYWEGLVHFCKADSFLSIYKSGCILAASTGLYGSRNPNETNAVCLTEATLPNWKELKKNHGDYGFVFRKRDIISLGGAPAIYLPQSVIDRMKASGEKLPQSLWPYLNKLNLSPAPSRYDFLYEREWRVPSDIDFAKAKPFAVTIPSYRPGIDNEEMILEAAREFGELYDYKGMQPAN